METPAGLVSSALFVEPEMSAQLELLDAVHDAHAKVELVCVSTCGGARYALESGDFDCLLLSTNLYHFDEERADLTALVHAAGARGVAVLAIRSRRPGALGVAVHESLSYEDVALGGLDRALARARARVARG